MALAWDVGWCRYLCSQKEGVTFDLEEEKSHTNQKVEQMALQDEQQGSKSGICLDSYLKTIDIEIYLMAGG